MSIRQGRPEDYSKGPYLIVLDVAPCPLTSLLCLSNPRESLPLPYPSTCRSSFAPLLSFLVIAGRVCSRFETSRRELIPSCAFPIQSFLLLFFFFVLQQYLPIPFLLLLPVAAVLSYPTRRETTRIEEIAFPPSWDGIPPFREKFSRRKSPFFLSSVSSALHEANAFPSVFSMLVSLSLFLFLSLRGNFVMHFIYSQRQILIYRGGTGKCPRERGTQGPRPFPFSSFLPPPRPYSCVQLWRERKREREGHPLGAVVVVATASLAFVATSPLAARQSRGASGAGEL